MIINSDYSYNCLNVLKNNIDINFYNSILNSLDFYLYKYLWNNIVNKWNNIIKIMNKNKNFINSKYYGLKFDYIHELISQEKLNKELKYFIDNDKLKCIIVIHSIEEII